MASKEKPIENQILNMLMYVGIFAWKNQSIGIFDPKKKVFRRSNNRHHINGVSDILAIHEGRFIAIEVKSETGKVSDYQKIFLAKVNEEGGVGMVARSARQAAEELSKHFPNNVRLKEYLIIS